jgi:transposase InsO family protein
VPRVGFTVFVVLIVPARAPRRILQLIVTEPPTAQWTAQQTAPADLFRDRDAAYRDWLQRCGAILGIASVLTAPRSPWQNAYADRVIGSIRRECLDHDGLQRRSSPRPSDQLLSLQPSPAQAFAPGHGLTWRTLSAAVRSASGRPIPGSRRTISTPRRNGCAIRPILLNRLT